MAIKYKQWKPPGIYPKDIQKYTGYADIKGACVKAGVTRYRLSPGRFQPLSLEETYKVMRVIRMLQGTRLMRKTNLT